MRLSAELVVLSACRTALGKEVRGEGLVGLTRGFMDAGAPRVVASLWKVSDRADRGADVSLLRTAPRGGALSGRGAARGTARAPKGAADLRPAGLGRLRPRGGLAAARSARAVRD